MEKTKITDRNSLVPWIGRTATLYCTVGVVMLGITGVLVADANLCWYGIQLSDGQKIGFSWGQYHFTGETINIEVR